MRISNNIERTHLIRGRKVQISHGGQMMECKTCFTLKCENKIQCKEVNGEKQWKELVTERLKEQGIYTETLTNEMADYELPTEEEPKEIRLPDMLPANYETLRDENGAVDVIPPKSCPIFRDERDPEGRLRHLAGLIMH